MHRHTPETQVPCDSPEQLLRHASVVDSVEASLHFNYFKEPLTLRGKSTDSATLYLRQGAFGVLFPGRTPEFQPGAADKEDEVK